MSNNYLKLVRRLKLWVIILAILNITIVSTIAVNSYRSKKQEAVASSGTDGINSFFKNYLDLSDSQKSEFDSLFNDYIDKRKEVGSRLRDVKERFYAPGAKEDSVEMNKIFDDFVAAQTLNRDLTVEFYKEVRAICTSIQKNKFNHFISQTSISEGFH